MSSMLEQAIVDATALREAALKNAEQAIIEKYAPQIKEAVESLLEGEAKPIGVGSYVRHLESNQVGEVRQIDEDGVQVIGTNGQVFLAEMDQLEKTEMLQEEDAGGNYATTATSAAPAVPMASAPQNVVDPNAQAELSMEFEFDPSDFEIDLDQIKAAAQEDPTSAGEEPEATEDLLGDLDADLDTELDLGDEEELTLQEMMEMINDVLTEEQEDEDIEEQKLEEELIVDVSEQKHGWVTTNATAREHDQDMALAQMEDSKWKEENEALIKRVAELQESLNQTNEDSHKLLGVVEQLKSKLDEALVSNARLVYSNKTLSDASLNERQKSKIVEAIAKATSAEEAKTLHETLTATVGSSAKSGPQSLSESVNRRSNLSAIMPRRKENVVTESMSFAERMKKLAGID